jgi:hypothetical protein
MSAFPKLLHGACAAALLLAGSCQSGTPWHQQADAEVVTLWDGHTLDGWKMAGPGKFVMQDGALKTTGGMGLLWYAAREFEDFRLEFEWKVDAADDNSGVFVRFPDPGDDPWVAVNQGYEIQICDTAPDKHNTGSVYSFQGPTATPTRPAGEWNQYRITVRGQRYMIEVNGILVNEFDGERGERGYVGLQNHSDEDAVSFRNLKATLL